MEGSCPSHSHFAEVVTVRLNINFVREAPDFGKIYNFGHEFDEGKHFSCCKRCCLNWIDASGVFVILSGWHHATSRKIQLMHKSTLTSRPEYMSKSWNFSAAGAKSWSAKAGQRVALQDADLA